MEKLEDFSEGMKIIFKYFKSQEVLEFFAISFNHFIILFQLF